MSILINATTQQFACPQKRVADAPCRQALHTVAAGIERLLKPCVSYDRISCHVLMMVDLDVHFHVMPRCNALCA